MIVVACAGLVAGARSATAQTDSVHHKHPDTPKRKVFTAPDPEALNTAHTETRVLPLVYAAGEELAPPEHGRPTFKIYQLDKGNSANMASGFYAEFKPRENDTLFLFDSASDHFDEVQIHAGKEVIQGDSVTVLATVTDRLNDYDARGNLVRSVAKKGKTNSMVIRSGFIPAQGLGSKRYRFAVVPGNFKLTSTSIISASVHMFHDSSSMGTVLCAVTKIDPERNMFFVETSNEIPRGENINWIIVNAP